MLLFALVVTLLTSLVGSIAEMKRRRGNTWLSVWSRAFVLHNKFPLTLCALAVAGFVIGVIEEIEAKRENEIKERNTTALLLPNQNVKPKIVSMIHTDRYVDHDLEGFLEWEASQPMKRLPRPRGFISSQIREYLFNTPTVQDEANGVGIFRVRTGEVGFDVHLLARNNGDMIQMGSMGSRIEGAKVKSYERELPCIVVECRGFEQRKPKALYQSLLRAYDEKIPVVLVHSFTPVQSKNAASLFSKSGKTGVIRIYVDEDEKLAVWARLKETHRIEKGQITSEWRISERPVVGY